MSSSRESDLFCNASFSFSFTIFSAAPLRPAAPHESLPSVAFYKKLYPEPRFEWPLLPGVCYGPDFCLSSPR